MIGMIIEICRKDLPADLITKSLHKNEHLRVPLAPGEGLMLNRVLYDSYNKMKPDFKMDVIVPKNDMPEVEKFKAELIACVGKQEQENKVFSKWMEDLDIEKDAEPKDDDEKEYKENNNAEEDA